MGGSSSSPRVETIENQDDGSTVVSVISGRGIVLFIYIIARTAVPKAVRNPNQPFIKDNEQ